MWLFLFLLLIPTQLGRHFWPEWSYVLGIRIDYLSPTLYLLDLVWLILIGNDFLKRNKPSALRAPPLTGRLFNLKKYLKFEYLAILAFVVINIVMAVNPGVAVYKWLRIGQIYLTCNYFRKNKKLVKEKLIKVIPCWIVFESLLAVAQMAKNGSLNGIFYWFGERSFTFNTIGVAQMSVLGNGLIRAYGTFSHPNSLAGFLLVAILLWVKLKTKDRHDGLLLQKNNIFWWVVCWLGLLGIMMTGSRTIWVLTLILISGWLFKNIKNKVSFIGLIILFLGMIGFGFFLINKEYQVADFLSGWDKNGIEKREQLSLAGLEMIKESPVFGVGLGNFLVRLPEFQKNNGVFWLQPVHNILILIVSEIGLGGLFLGWWFLKENFNWKKTNWVFKIIFGMVIISGMGDHYWLTLPQNVWLLVLVLGIA